MTPAFHQKSDFSRLIFSLLFLSSSSVFSAEASMDELLQGFDDSEPAASASTVNENESELDDLLSGFDEPADNSTATNNSETSAIDTVVIENRWNLNTLLSVSSSYSYQQSKPATGEADYRGITHLKFKLQPELRYKFNDDWDSVFSVNAFYDPMYRIKGRSDFTDEALESSESELEVRELYLRGTLTNSLDIKIGRQIVVWGKSDSLRVVDVLNPLDFREPGMVDIEDLRLPVTMLKTDYYTGDWNISFIVIPEIRFNKMPAYGSDFYFGGSKPPADETIPDDISNPEFALAFIGNFSGWDLSLHFANYYNDSPHFVNTTPPHLEHSRLNMAGAAANVVKGSWLFKSEIAYIDGLEFANSNNEFARGDAMVGIDYNGVADMTFSVETVNRHIMDYEAILNTPKDNTQKNENQISLRYTASFMHDKLNATILTSFFGKSPDDGGFYRGSFDYEINQGMSIIFGGIVYQSGDSQLLKSIASNDRVFVDYRYSF